MLEHQLSTDIADIKAILRANADRLLASDLKNEARLTRIETSVTNIEKDVTEIRSRSTSDHDEITQLKAQMTVRPAGAVIVSVIVSVVASFFGLRLQP